MSWIIEPCDIEARDFWARWDQLNRDHCASHPLLSSTMARMLVKYFGEQPMYAASFYQAGRCVAQTIVQRFSTARWTIFSPSQAPVSPIVYDRAVVDGATVLRKLLANLPGFGLLIEVPCDDAPYSMFANETSLPMRSHPLGTTINIRSTEGNFEQYWATRGRDLKQNIRRYFKRAEQAGAPRRFVAIKDSAEIGAAVDRFGELESAGWKGREGTALHPTNVQGRFYRQLMQEFAVALSAQALELYLGEQLVASRLLISGPAMHVMLKTTYREELKHLAVGRLLLYSAVESLLTNERERSIEFYTRANEDMLAWATDTRLIRGITLYRNSFVMRLAELKSRWAARSTERNQADVHAAQNS